MRDVPFLGDLVNILYNNNQQNCKPTYTRILIIMACLHLRIRFYRCAQLYETYIGTFPDEL